ncbi:pyruvate carboxylase [Sandaracinobacter sp. RS1-74]|uniref:pyruvate carboxylase n=1 Tax=Sandaracinobacteroides sayramensis TaxID=2913411 RepID=UPI001ED9F2B3|nr:pyruvate carboxylase [Sandaracinobacteroides sayramensis]MCG2841079.1 pyruvate carboxylase [Sandaracinobacteroides sayramensis]
MKKRIRRLMVANRSEIAIRVFRAAAEMDIATVAIYAEEDRLSLHRFKSDEAYRVGVGKGPLQAYLDVDDIIATALRAGVDAIHPGYGFLSESPEFAEACAAAGLVFIGPSPTTMRQLGNKVAARNLAISAGVPVMPATDPLPYDAGEIRRLASEIGYPLMLKASWGGGGRGMRPIESEERLIDAVAAARREAAAAFGKDEVYLEKLVRKARHVEVQLLGDGHGNLVHLFERDCSIQRRHQKVVERAPAPYLDDARRLELAEAALRIGRATDYVGAGTVEFLMDADTGRYYFIEVNPRIQVEHTVTEVVTGLDIVKAQIRIAEGGRIGEVGETGIPAQSAIRLDGHALQCRVTTEDPDRGFAPDYGRITAYRGASGFGLRIDGGTAYSGAVVTPFYDAMLEKVTAWAPTPREAIARMDRALREYRIRGVATNLPFLEAVLGHPDFQSMNYTTRFIDDTPALFNLPKRRDRATKLLASIADVTINGHAEMKDRTPVPTNARAGEAPVFGVETPAGSKQRFDALGAEGFARWMRAEQKLLVTDTTMRDAHQSLLATRMRSFDLVPAARAYASGLPELLSLECWGGATFDVAMRFLTEDPWERLAAIRAGAPNLLLQMLLRGANGVGYTNYPDNVVRFFIRQAAEAGIDLFRVFDCLNWVENMRVAIDAVCEAGKIAEGAICYTGDLFDPARAKYSLAYYADLARQLDKAGCHVLAIKDMAGLLRPAGARALIAALRDVTDLPIHLHTHDTSGIAGATLIAAAEAGVDAIDVATDAMSGTTSQPCLGSVVEALRHTPRDTGLDAEAIRRVSFYWEGVRGLYAPFESDLRSGASEVYLHEMPGGQFTNLKEQARALGLAGRWHEVARAYREANDLFGDIVKVTPSSKVVGDMALMMVAQGLTPADVLDPGRDIAFPASVVEMLRGDLGQPVGGWPDALQKKALKGERPIADRPAAHLPAADLELLRRDAQTLVGRPVGDRDLASWLMYPKVFADFARASAAAGPVSALPTPVFFGGMKPGEEIVVEIEPGKSLIIRLQAIGEPEADGQVKLFFELNGQPRVIRVADRSRAVATTRRKAEDGNDRHIAAPMAGAVSTIAVRKGQKVSAGDPLLTLEAMKMETTLSAPRAGVVADIAVAARDSIEAKDLLLVLE